MGSLWTQPIFLNVSMKKATHMLSTPHAPSITFYTWGNIPQNIKLFGQAIK